NGGGWWGRWRYGWGGRPRVKKPAPRPSPIRWEQRYLILEFKVWVFKDVVHENDEFAHDSGEGDFCGFAGLSEALIKLFEETIGMSSDQSGHVEGATYRGAATSDGTAALPLSAFSGMRSQSSQGRCLAPIQSTQFGQFGQDPQSGEGAHAGNGFEFLNTRLQARSLLAQFLELAFDVGHCAFEPAHQALGLASQCRQGESFDLLALGDEDLQNLNPAANQFGKLLLLLRAGCRGFGAQVGAVIRKDRGVESIRFGALPKGAGKVPDAGGIKHTDRDAGGVQSGDDFPLITAGGFANHLAGGMGLEKLEGFAVARGGVGQVMETTCQMELQVLLGNIQAGDR